MSWLRICVCVVVQNMPGKKIHKLETHLPVVVHTNLSYVHRVNNEAASYILLLNKPNAKLILQMICSHMYIQHRIEMTL